MRHCLLTFTLVAWVVGLAGGVAHAADAPRPAPRPAVAPKKAKTPPPPPAPAAASVAPTHESLAPLNAEEMAIAQRVHLGRLPCELGQTVRVEADTHQPGYFRLQGAGFVYRMRPVSTSSGAIRLEDAKAGAVWLQLANKSMLMDQKQGRRVADECAHPEQMAYAEEIKRNPPPALIEMPPGR